MKILPLGKFDFQTFPLQDESGNDLAGVIDIGDVDIGQIGLTLQFDDSLTKIIPFDNQKLKIEQKKSELRAQLISYSEDFMQVFAGAKISDIEERKKKFLQILNELRSLEGKESRELM